MSKSNVYFYIALVCAIWFMVFSSSWMYWMCLVIAYPAGIVSYILWHIGRKQDERIQRYKIIMIILIVGLVLSIAAIGLMLFGQSFVYTNN